MEITFSYNWICSYLEGAPPRPEELEEALTHRSFEVAAVKEAGDDVFFTIDILPNRAHDCLAHYFLAKEVSALFGMKLKDLIVHSRDTEKKELAPQVRIEDKKRTVRYMARVLTQVRIEESPAWLKRRLLSIGQKPINNVVDATNYVMWSINQPLHAFDADKVEGACVVVRNAREGERIETLDGREVVLEPDMLVIADARKLLAIAGVKGGKAAEVTDATKSIILESANFDAGSVRRTSQKLGIRTDSSKRFEHEISPRLAALGMEMATRLIIDIAGTHDSEVSFVADEGVAEEASRHVVLQADAANKLLGTAIDEGEVGSILTRAGFAFSRKKGAYDVEIPPERLDLTEEADLIEELGRMYGYEKVGAMLPPDAGRQPKVDKELFYRLRASECLAEGGFSEVYTYVFEQNGEVELENPLATDKRFLRSALAPGLAGALLQNLYYADLLGLDAVRIFEIGKVFKKGYHEHNSCAVGIARGKLTKGKKKEREQIDEALVLVDRALGVPEGTCAQRTRYTEAEYGLVAEMHFDELLEGLPEPGSYEEVLPREGGEKREYRHISPFPFVLRDIAVWTPRNASSEEILLVVARHAGRLLQTATLFDVYKKEDRVSYAFRLAFQSDEKTLTDEEINGIMEHITKDLDVREGWQVR